MIMLAEISTTQPTSPDYFGSLIQPAVIFVLGLALLTYGIWKARKKKLATQHKIETGQIAPPPPVITPSELRATANELHSLLADLNDMSRRIAAQIDNRYIKLDATIADADKKIKHLESLLAQVEQYALDPGEAPAQTPAAPPVESAPEITVSSNPAATGMTSTYARIYDLADRGHTVHEIAQQVHLQPGEVDLILKLRPAAKS